MNKQQLNQIANNLIHFFSYEKEYNFIRDIEGGYLRMINLENDVINVYIEIDYLSETVRLEPALIKDLDIQRHIFLERWNKKEVEDFLDDFIKFAASEEEE